MVKIVQSFFLIYQWTIWTDPKKLGSEERRTDVISVPVKVSLSVCTNGRRGERGTWRPTTRDARDWRSSGRRAPPPWWLLAREGPWTCLLRPVCPPTQAMISLSIILQVRTDANKARCPQSKKLNVWYVMIWVQSVSIRERIFMNIGWAFNQFLRDSGNKDWVRERERNVNVWWQIGRLISCFSYPRIYLDKKCLYPSSVILWGMFFSNDSVSQTDKPNLYL